MEVEKYWPGSMTWQQIVETIDALPTGRFGHEEISTVMQIAGLLNVFRARGEKQVSNEQKEQLATGGTIVGGVLGDAMPERETEYVPKGSSVLPLRFPWATLEQVRLIVRILDGLCMHFEEPAVTPLGMVAMQCRFCKAQGTLFGLDQMRYEHTDECVLALNARLQESLKELARE